MAGKSQTPYYEGRCVRHCVALFALLEPLLTMFTKRSRLCCPSNDSLRGGASAPPEGALSRHSVFYSAFPAFRDTIALDH
ncbi:hypothetical protein NDU88_005092 [Pleurodeles waltl]|uniref:Uncharacterized protein n=1 Tax=Pleurodeles waltl TaxID=8319 RepID=A0AAV7QDQ6_PLEWA|nr:hypothetical protein NDU88_005092 [Pleurodeles waltl]